MGGQVGDQFMAVLVAIGRFLGDHLRQDPGDLRVDIGVQFTHVGDLGAHHFEHQAERRFVGERHAPGQHFEQHDAEREDVRALVDRLAEADFRRQIARGADEFAGRGQLLRQVLVDKRDAEVGDLDLAAARSPSGCRA